MKDLLIEVGDKLKQVGRVVFVFPSSASLFIHQSTNCRDNRLAGRGAIEVIEAASGVFFDSVNVYDRRLTTTSSLLDSAKRSRRGQPASKLHAPPRKSLKKSRATPCHFSVR